MGLKRVFTVCECVFYLDFNWSGFIQKKAQSYCKATARILQPQKFKSEKIKQQKFKNKKKIDKVKE